MRATVFTDPALTKHAGRFVWLSIDSENPNNAEFVAKYPIEAWPTFEVLAPQTGEIVYRWLGSADVRQLEQRFDEAALALTTVNGAAADREFARAQRLEADGRKKDAIAAYDATLAAGGPAWPRRARAAEALVGLLAMGDDAAACARRAADLGADLAAGPSRANVAASGLGCALAAPKDAAWRAAALPKLEGEVREALGWDGLLADDRSSFYGLLLDARNEQGDAAGAKTLAEAWFAFLEQDGQRAASAEARAALDGHRVSAALALGDPARAVPALERSEKDLPRDYNPPARLALLLREMGRYDDALAASDRALALAYGPRKLGLYDGRATIFEKKGDRAGAKRTLLDALLYAKTLPDAQRSKGMVARLEKRLAGL